ncbi:MAG TPA: hypothetical protein VIB82_09820 [Caulobacteraceae bacterium]|jgi:ElaB/YqjD/DUF883 family membrane-anchored ribosome-binding protein
MSTDTLEHSVDQATHKAAAASEKGQKAFNDALAAAQQTISDAAKAAERALRDGAETLNAHTKTYRENAGQQLDEAQRFVLERVRERPVTAALAGLGAGLLLGLLLSNRDK